VRKVATLFRVPESTLRDRILGIVSTGYAVQLGRRSRDKPLTMKWMRGFFKRWPVLKVVKPKSLEHARAKMAS